MNTISVLERAPITPPTIERELESVDRPDQQPPAVVSYLPWARPGRPATTTDERRFVRNLRALADERTQPHNRSDVTAVLNALRGGLSVDDLLTRAPGLVPARLWSAYELLERERSEAVAAWTAIMGDPTVATLEANADVAARLLPVPIARLRQVASESAALLGDAIADACRRLDATAYVIGQIERVLDLEPPGGARAFDVGRQLVDVDGDSLFARDHHLPSRVGALSSQRVADLLGERSGDAA